MSIVRVVRREVKGRDCSGDARRDYCASYSGCNGYEGSRGGSN